MECKMDRGADNGVEQEANNCMAYVEKYNQDIEDLEWVYNRSLPQPQNLLWAETMLRPVGGENWITLVMLATTTLKITTRSQNLRQMAMGIASMTSTTRILPAPERRKRDSMTMMKAKKALRTREAGRIMEGEAEKEVHPDSDDEAPGYDVWTTIQTETKMIHDMGLQGCFLRMHNDKNQSTGV
jgi:hypothetical protein